MSFEVNVVCPKCEAQEVNSFTGPDREVTVCKKCATTFTFLYAKVRAKRSRGNRSENRREFDIRIYLSNESEELISFVKTGWDDIELRSKDDVIFVFLGDKVKVIQNIKIGSYSCISEPYCYIATHIFGAQSEEVAFLQRWRDKVLYTTVRGRIIISTYYFLSTFLIKNFGNSMLISKLCNYSLNWVLKKLGFSRT